METIEDGRAATIAARKAGEKSVLLEQLKKTPIVQIACEKASVSRASYYRWRKEDTEFSEAADLAIRHGSDLVNDMAESQLMAAIRDRNLTAIIFWLRHHHPKYSQKIELLGNLTINQEELTPEEEALVRRVLENNV
ncbi:hypothetical protein KBD61_01340 [Patescibacteria group bacterium]|nr:hypothetical protein [Patescibacteria group bacterium]MBP9709653.1 hypothetical protein [Patescibacteria group bacterium]